MSGTEQAYHLTKEDVRKAEQRESNAHGGNIPADSQSAGLQVSRLNTLAVLLRLERHTLFPNVSEALALLQASSILGFTLQLLLSLGLDIDMPLNISLAVIS